MKDLIKYIRSKQLLKVLLLIILIIVSFFFFWTYSNILTTEKIFTSNSIIVVLDIALPILLFALTICFLTFNLLIYNKYYPIIVIPITFIVSQKFSLISIPSGILLFIAFFIFSKFFLKNLKDFIDPSLSRCMKSALGIPLTILSIVIALNFYPVYYNLISTQNFNFSDTLTLGAARYFDSIYFRENNINRLDTLKTFATSSLTRQKKPVTETNLKSEESTIKSTLGVSDAKDTDTMISLLNKALTNQIKNIINSFKTQILVFIPLAFFFITQTFSSISSYLSFLIVLVMEFINKNRNIQNRSGKSLIELIQRIK